MNKSLQHIKRAQQLLQQTSFGALHEKQSFGVSDISFMLKHAFEKSQINTAVAIEDALKRLDLVVQYNYHVLTDDDLDKLKKQKTKPKIWVRGDGLGQGRSVFRLHDFGKDEGNVPLREKQYLVNQDQYFKQMKTAVDKMSKNLVKDAAFKQRIEEATKAKSFNPDYSKMLFLATSKDQIQEDTLNDDLFTDCIRDLNITVKMLCTGLQSISEKKDLRVHERTAFLLKQALQHFQNICEVIKEGKKDVADNKGNASHKEKASKGDASNKEKVGKKDTQKKMPRENTCLDEVLKAIDNVPNCSSDEILRFKRFLKTNYFSKHTQN